MSAMPCVDDGMLIVIVLLALVAGAVVATVWQELQRGKRRLP